ncbi:unnamed protein product [Symbiodinium sp. KB8]|nr:unnamed protein product [Symbiodinium sp. KB8]
MWRRLAVLAWLAWMVEGSIETSCLIPKTEVAISGANLVAAPKARRFPDRVAWHTFRFDGVSWAWRLSSQRPICVWTEIGSYSQCRRMARTDSGHSNCLHQGQASACFDFPSSSSVLLVMDDQTSLVARRYFRQGEAVSTARIYEWNGTSTSWLGPVSSIKDPYNPNASNPTTSNFIDTLDIDGNSLIVACHLFPRVDYTVTIYEHQEDSWPLVFRTVLDEN